jgi:putative transposase
MAFVTITTHRNRPVFQVSRLAELFIEVLLHYRTRGHYKLHAYLVMPDCVHLILTPQGMALKEAIFLIKTGFVHILGPDVPIWQATFGSHSIASARDLKILRTYLHQVPVHADLTTSPELYPYSSAHRVPVHETPAQRSHGRHASNA